MNITYVSGSSPSGSNIGFAMHEPPKFNRYVRLHDWDIGENISSAWNSVTDVANNVKDGAESIWNSFTDLEIIKEIKEIPRFASI